MKRAGVVLSLVLLFCARAGMGQPAQTLTFRGPLHDGKGKALAGPVELVFRIYDAPLGGSLIAGPFGPSRITPVAGIFSADFGPVAVDRMDGGPRWLEITVGASPLPRIQMEKVYYDWVDEQGKLAGGRTFAPWSPPARTTVDSTVDSERSAGSASTILDNGPPSNRLDLVFVGDGYVESELDVYANHARHALDELLSHEPFATYRTFFNAHRVDVISNESGVDNDPDPGIFRDTALDMAFWCGGLDRLLCVDVGKAYLHAFLAPGTDQVLAVANSTKYGGAGYIFSDLATLAGGNGAAAEIAIHEIGHSLGNLADEYDYGGPVRYVGPEPSEVNVSTLQADQMAESGTKWARWLGDPGLGFGGLVDTYEGAHYSRFGIYRPTFDSKMRSLGQPFNLPSVENLIVELYKVVRPIDNATPAGTLLDQSSTAFVDPVDPAGHPLEIQWYIDGNPVPEETHETFRICTGGIALGDHVLSVTVKDNTPLVRDETLRSTWLTESRSWDLHISGSNDTDCRPIVTAPPGASGVEGAPLSFVVSAADPNGDAISLLSATGTAVTAGGMFTPDPSNTSGTFHWTPGYDQAGSYNVTFTAENALSGSASTSITINNVNLPPAVTAPVAANGGENTLIAFGVSSTDPDGDLVGIAAGPLPSGAEFGDLGNNTGTFNWVPGYDQAGSYRVTFTGTDGSGGADTVETAITVSPVDRAPAVVAPGSRLVSEADLLTFAVTVSDPDAEPIASLTTSPLPTGATFTADEINTSGTFTWTPDHTQAGSYQVTFTAANALSSSVGTSIAVQDVIRLPVVTAPTSVSGVEGTLLEFTAAISDPDGEEIDSLRAAPLPPGATFTASGTRTAGIFSWEPGYTQEGTYSVTISAQSACRASVVSGITYTECETGTATIPIEIGNTDRAPVVATPASMTVDEGVPVAFAVTASDPDGQEVASLEVAGIPLGATFTSDPSNSSGAFNWTPGFAQAGTYSVVFSAANVLTGSATTEITVRNVNRAPVADAGGPYSAAAGVPVFFDGAGSSDPDGDALTHAWDFGDDASSSGETASHIYGAGGTYIVTLTVSDPGSPPLSASATTTANIAAVLDGRVFTLNANRAIRLDSGKPRWCAQVEPIAANFNVSEVILSSIVLKYGGRQIPIISDKASTFGDRDQNGSEEVEVCFGKADLRTLFEGLPRGRATVTVSVEGSLLGGALFRGSSDVDVLGSVDGLVASLSPNPLNPYAMLTFKTTVGGRVKISVFDLRGSLIRTLLDEPQLPSGYHDVRIDGVSEAGSRLASGVYFYRIEASEGVAAGRFVIMK